MAFTMHSHSGQFCPGHAKDELEEIVRHAISIGYKTMALTEHMPRLETCDLYPEEPEAIKRLEKLSNNYSFAVQIGPNPEESIALLSPRHDAYLIEAQRLRTKYASEINILIGFEGEWYRPSYGPFISSLAAHPVVDFFIGSIHHVNGIPIDYDKETYARARDSAGGTDEALYEQYYDQQHEMLETLHPRVVGHFDLIRLMSEAPSRDVREWKGVWERILRNLKVALDCGALLECNSSALRKGLDEPYPCRAVAEQWLIMGGRFTFSDDSHGIAQVATNYARNVSYLESLGVQDVYTFERIGPGAALQEKAVSLLTFREAFGER